MANEIRERFRERKYSYKNKRKKIKENKEVVMRKGLENPKVPSTSPAALTILSKEKLCG